MAFGFRRTDGVEGGERVTDEALAAEIDVVERVRGRYPAGSRINFVHPRDAGGVLVELVEPASEPGH